MKNDRLRVPIDAPYVQAVGLATICFARLEWNVVWCCEKLQPGFIQSLGLKTAGKIAERFGKLAASHVDPAIATSLGNAAIAFKELVDRRNALVHAKPGSTRNDEQRLFRDGAEWTLQMIHDLSDEFAAAELQLNHCLHNLLS